MRTAKGKPLLQRMLQPPRAMPLCNQESPDPPIAIPRSARDSDFSQDGRRIKVGPKGREKNVNSVTTSMLLTLCRKIPATCFSRCRKQPFAKNPCPENIPGFSPWRSGKSYHKDQATVFLPEKPALAKLDSFVSSQARWHGFLHLGLCDACKAYSRACQKAPVPCIAACPDPILRGLAA